MRYPVIAAACVLAASAAPSSAQVMAESGTSPRISVTVTRIARLTPDRATVYATIEGTGETAADAAARADKKAQAVVDALRPLGVKIEGPMPYGTSPMPVMNGYPGNPQTPQVVSRQLIRVPITRLSQASAVASAALAAGASAAPVTGYESSVADSARRALYADAVAGARSEGAALAAAMNAELGRPSDASVTMTPIGSPYSNYVNFFSRGFDAPQTPPEVVVTATVVVRFPITYKP